MQPFHVERSGLLCLRYDGRCYVACPSHGPGMFLICANVRFAAEYMGFWAGYYTPDGKWEDGRINLSTAVIVSNTARDTKDGFAYAQEL